MPIRTRPFVRVPLAAACMALLFACAAQADEIYKWVDKEGKTHYSSRKEDAEGAAMTTMHPPMAPPSSAITPPRASSANEEIIRRNVQGTIDSRYTPPVAVEKPVVRNYRSEAPADKCQFARDILSGVATHDNGMPTSEQDKAIAQNDIRTYCGK